MTAGKSLVLCIAVPLALGLSGCAELTADNPLLGKWQAASSLGGDGLLFRKLAFTEERIYAEGPKGRLLRFEVRGYEVAADRIRVRTDFGETFAFERMNGDLICLERPRIRKLEGGTEARESELRDRRCYRRA